MFKKMAAGTGLIVAAGAAVVGINTARFSPADVAGTLGIRLAAAPVIDVPKAAERLSAAIRFQTISNQDPTQNKVEEWAKLQDWLKASYPAAHAHLKRSALTSRTMLFEWPGSDPAAKPIILMAHQDVVPVTPGTEGDWKYPPFEGKIAENAVWGRGTIDDKGSLIGLFEALEILAKQGFKPKRSIWIVSGDDEEVGGTGAKGAATLLASNGVKALFTLDEGSAIVTDAPVVNGPAVLIGVSEKGYGTLKVTARAKGGHSSMPPEDIGTVNLAKAIVAIHAHQFSSALHPPVTAMIEALATRKWGMVKVAAANQWLFGGVIRAQFASTPSGASMLHTTIAPTMLEGSPKENVLPQAANALINFRIAPWDSSADVLAHIQKSVVGMPVTLSWTKPPREPSPISSTTSLGWSFVRAAGEAEAPGAVVAPYLVVAGTDSRSMSAVSDDVYRFIPIKVSLKETAMIHGTNEHMTLDNLEHVIRFFTRLIATSAG
jgi:carboxypeptidase PM20D1